MSYVYHNLSHNLYKFMLNCILFFGINWRKTTLPLNFMIISSIV
jgi:hypothetical protein